MNEDGEARLGCLIPHPSSFILPEAELMARIVSIATDNPPHAIDNAAGERVLVRHTRRLGLRPEPYLRVFKNIGIETRYSVLPPDTVDAPRTLEERNGL